MEALSLGEQNLQNLNGAGENREIDNRQQKQASTSRGPATAQGVSQNTLPIAVPSMSGRIPIQDVVQPESPMLTAPRRPLGENWQTKGATVRERNAYLFNNDLMSDVKFLVGPKNAAQRVPAHKYVLASGSSVFFAMFYGDLAENQLEIAIPDVEPQAFLTLLKYLYSDEVDLTPDNVLTTLYAAKKYIVPHLAQACVSFLERSLSARNACVLLSQSHLFEEPDLMQRCWEVIDAQAEVALSSDSFLDVDHMTLESILMRETLNVKEIVLLQAVSKWADAECGRKGVAPDSDNKRKVLGNALYLVRIPTMLVTEIANEAVQCGLLTTEETNNVFLHHLAKSKPKLKFVCLPRKGLRTCKVHRFQSSAYRSNQWRYRGRCDSIQFAVDKRIFIAGFGLYGSSSGAADYGIKIELKRSGKVLGETQTKFFSDGSSCTFSVMLPNPVQVEPHAYYTASVVLCGSELSYFGQEGLTEVTDHGVTFQFQCSPESTNGTGVQGGQIPELIFYA